MGYTLARRVEAMAMAGTLPPLSRNAHMALIGMALNARDRDGPEVPRDHYFRTWEHLAIGWLGYEKYDATAERAVARAVKELVDAGIIEAKTWRLSARGPRVYQIHLSLLKTYPQPVDNPPRRPPRTPPLT